MVFDQHIEVAIEGDHVSFEIAVRGDCLDRQTRRGETADGIDRGGAISHPDVHEQTRFQSPRLQHSHQTFIQFFQPGGP
jgi:hypothetical protein